MAKSLDPRPERFVETHEDAFEVTSEGTQNEEIDDTDEEE